MPERWITLNKAIETTGHDTVSGLDQFIRRWNKSNPTNLIRRMPGRVEAGSLRAALKVRSDKYTPGMATRKAVSKHIAGLSGRR